MDDNQGGAPNYFPNSFGGPQPVESVSWHAPVVSGNAKKYQTEDEDNFSQVSVFYNKVLDAAARDRLTSNIAGHLRNASPFIQKRTVANFMKVDPHFGRSIEQKLVKAAL